MRGRGGKIPLKSENSRDSTKVQCIDILDNKTQYYSFVKIVGKRSLTRGATGEGNDVCILRTPKKGHVRRSAFASCHMKKRAMQSDRPFHMANQTDKLFAAQEGKAFAAIAEHPGKRSNPTVRAQICAHFTGGGSGFDSLIRQAVGATRSASEVLHHRS